MDAKNGKALAQKASVELEERLDGRSLLEELLSNAAATAGAREEREGLAIESDGETLVLRAEKEIVLRCGEASLTLTREGKVLIRGAYVSTRSSRVNRVNGASVQIN